MRNWVALSKYIFRTSQLALGCGCWEISISKLRWERGRRGRQSEEGKEGMWREREWGEGGGWWNRHPLQKSSSPCYSCFFLQRSLVCVCQCCLFQSKLLHLEKHTEGRLERLKYKPTPFFSPYTTQILSLKPFVDWCWPQKECVEQKMGFFLPHCLTYDLWASATIWIPV